MHGRALFFIAAFAVFGALGSMRPTSATPGEVTVTVSSTGNPWLAGMPNGSTAGGSDVVPDQSPAMATGLTVIPGNALTFDVTGSTNFQGQVPSDPPDGTPATIFHHAAINGISETYAPANGLVGVFIGNASPNPALTPTTLSFITQASRDYATLAPMLQQVFFIGDGRTSTGEIQSVVAPAGATRLFLGSMDGLEWNNNTGQFSVRVRDPASSAPILEISKAVAPALTQVAPGGALTYTLTYSSQAGRASLTDPVVIDPLPNGTAFVSAFFLDAAGAEVSSPVPGPNGLNPEFSGGNVIWYLGSAGQRVLPSGATGRLKLNVQVQAVDLTVSTIRNESYSLQGKMPDGSTITGNGPAVDVPVATALVRATLQVAQTSVAPGDSLYYLYTITNGTAKPIKFVTLTSTVPQGTATVAETPVATASGAARVWNLGTLKPGKVARVLLQVQLRFNPDLSQHQVDNVGSLVSYTVSPNIVSLPLAPLSTPITGLPTTMPQLGVTIRAVTKSDSTEDSGKTALAGEEITYFIDYVNTGSAVARNCVLVDAVPSPIVGVPHAIQAKGQYDANTHQIRWSLGDLNPGGPQAAGSSGTVSFKVKAPTRAPAVVSNGFYTITSAGLNGLTNGTPDHFLVSVVDPARFFIEVIPNVSSLPAMGGSGQHIVYNISFINLGGVIRTPVVVTDRLPDGTQIVADQFGGPARTVTNGVVTWHLPTVPTRTWQTIKLEVATTVISGAIVDEASISGGAAAPVSAQVATPIIQDARLFVWIKTAMSVSLGNTNSLVYTIVYGNTGSGTAHDVQVTDTVPTGTTFQSANSGGALNGPRVVWSGLGDLDPGEAGAVTLTVTVIGAGRIENHGARISSGGSGAAALLRGGPLAAVQADPSARSTGAVATTVRGPNDLQGFWESFGGFFQSIGSSLGNFFTRVFSLPQLKQDVAAVRENSTALSLGGVDTLGLKTGVTVVPMGNGISMVTGPPGAINPNGSSVISNDGGSITVVGDATQISVQIGGAFGTLSAADAIRRAVELVAAGAGNLVATGGGNLITNDGGSVVSNDGGSLVPVVARTGNLVATGGGNGILAGGGGIVAARLIGDSGSTLIGDSASTLVSHDGGTIVQVNGGNVISSQAGIIGLNDAG